MIRDSLKRLIVRTLRPRIGRALLMEQQQQTIHQLRDALANARQVITLLEGDAAAARGERDKARAEVDVQRAEKERQQRLRAEETDTWNRERLRLEEVAKTKDGQAVANHEQLTGVIGRIRDLHNAWDLARLRDGAVNLNTALACEHLRKALRGDA